MTDRAFMSSKQLDASDRAYQAYQSRLASKVESIRNDAYDMEIIIHDLASQLVGPISRLGRLTDGHLDMDAAYELHKLLDGYLKSVAAIETPESIEEDYE